MLALDDAYSDEHWQRADRAHDRVDGLPWSPSFVLTAARPVRDEPQPPFVRCRACGALQVGPRHACTACDRPLRHVEIPADEQAARHALGYGPLRPDSQVQVFPIHKNDGPGRAMPEAV